MTDEAITELNDEEADEFIATLEKIRVDPVNWLVLYRDPRTGLFWLQDNPQSELHGGGPRRIRLIVD